MNPTAYIPTLSTDNPRRGRRAGMPLSEEKKDDQDKITFGARRLGQNRQAARDPFAYLDKPPQTTALEEKKED